MLPGKVTIHRHERGLLFRDGEFLRVLDPGYHWSLGFLAGRRVDIVRTSDPWLVHDRLDEIVVSGELADRAHVVDLTDDQRGLVWIDKRFARVLGPGLHVLWKDFKEVRIEVVAAGGAVRFEHPTLSAILGSPGAERELLTASIEEGMAGILFVDGALRTVLPPGRHAFWHRMGRVAVVSIDLRESVVDISGQEIMTRDKVSLRLNGLAAYRVADPVRAVTGVGDYRQSLYREIQLGLRAVVGTTELDRLLADKDALADRVKNLVVPRASDFGLTLTGFGIRDIILPGDMKELLNKVVESQKAAEANLITRREETAAMRSQANTARLLADNPTLMRLRELEVLEKVVAGGRLQVICGEQGIAEKVMKLI